MLTELNIGSNVQFSKLPQSQLSNKKFIISKINKYKFEHISNTSFKIENGAEFFFISSIPGEDYIAVSRVLTDQEVSNHFNLEEFALVFSNNTDFDIHTHKVKIPLNEWIEHVYTKNFDYVKGSYYHENNLDSGDKFYYYTISAKNSSVDIEAFDCGKIVFYITIYLPSSSIVA